LAAQLHTFTLTIVAIESLRFLVVGVDEGSHDEVDHSDEEEDEEEALGFRFPGHPRH